MIDDFTFLHLRARLRRQSRELRYHRVILCVLAGAVCWLVLR